MFTLFSPRYYEGRKSRCQPVIVAMEGYAMSHQNTTGMTRRTRSPEPGKRRLRERPRRSRQDPEEYDAGINTA
jgi:hypothetical protein